MRSSVVARSSAGRPSGSGSTLRGTFSGVRLAVNPQLTHPSTTLSTKIEAEAEVLFHRYAYPDWLRTHSLLVGRIALLLADAHGAAGAELEVGDVAFAAYVHDIGRSPLLEGDEREHHDLSGLVLAAEGLGRFADLARRHPIYVVLDPATAPRTLAEKIVQIADRRGGLEVLSLEERFAEVAARHPRYTAQIERAKPIVRALEREVFAPLPFGPDDLAERIHSVWP